MFSKINFSQFKDFPASKGPFDAHIKPRWAFFKADPQVLLITLMIVLVYSSVSVAHHSMPADA